jgi:hypothetical protein
MTKTKFPKTPAKLLKINDEDAYIKQARAFLKQQTKQIEQKNIYLGKFNTSNKTEKISNAHKLMDFLLQHNLAIGEKHGDISPKHWLIYSFQDLYKCGYRRLYLEHLFKNEHKELIDKLNTTKKMPHKLALYLRELSKGQMLNKYNEIYNYETVVIKAIETGFKIIPLDIKKFYEHKAKTSTSHNRYITFSYTAAKIINDDLRDNPLKLGEKWICFVGSSHINNMFLKTTGKDYERIAGIKNLTENCIDFAITDSFKQTLQFCRKFKDEHGNYTYITIESEEPCPKIQKQEKKENYINELSLAKTGVRSEFVKRLEEENKSHISFEKMSTIITSSKTHSEKIKEQLERNKNCCVIL